MVKSKLIYLKNETKFEVRDKRLKTALFKRNFLKSKERITEPTRPNKRTKPAITTNTIPKL